VPDLLDNDGQDVVQGGRSAADETAQIAAVGVEVSTGDAVARVGHECSHRLGKAGADQDSDALLDGEVPVDDLGAGAVGEGAGSSESVNDWSPPSS
jgi:hypothetical protein